MGSRSNWNDDAGTGGRGRSNWNDNEGAKGGRAKGPLDVVFFDDGCTSIRDLR